MKWASAVSEHENLRYAVAECVARIRTVMPGQDLDLVVAFVSAHHSAQYHEIPILMRHLLAPRVMVGCSGGGIIGDGMEVENRPGVSLAAAVLPDINLVGFRIEDADLPDGDAPPSAWENIAVVAAANDPQFLLLSDPFSMRGENLLMGLDYAFPRSAKIGGLASGGQQPGSNALYLGDETYNDGAVGVAMHGNVAVDTIVAQGCRPIGRRMQITSSDGNVLLELDGQNTMDVVRDMLYRLDERDMKLAQRSLFLGVVMDEFNDDPKLGDFLIRNIIGLDARRGAIAVGERLKEGQTVQFHLRDAETSSQDLDEMLTHYAADGVQTSGAGALLFQCLGRGSYLYGRADHDTDMFREKVGAIPLTGFFCNGEIGQVSGSTYLHGYTSSFGIFRSKTTA